MATGRKNNLFGGFISFGIEALILMGIALVAAVIAWLAISLVG